MSKHLALVPLCGVLLGACAPGAVLRSPAVVGSVTNTQTHLPLAGVRVVVIVPGDDPAASPLPDAVSDAQGHFSLEARYQPSLMFTVGHPEDTPVIVQMSKAGYGGYEIHTGYNLHTRPFGPLHADGELDPSPPPKKS